MTSRFNRFGSGMGLTLDQQAQLAGAEQVSNKDQPDGYPGLDGLGRLPVGIAQIRTGTKAELAIVELADGEPAYETDTGVLLIGDSGENFRVTSYDNSLAVHVFPRGTPQENFQQFLAAKAAAETIIDTEASSPMYVVLHPGDYDAADNKGVIFDVDRIGVVAAIPGTALFTESNFAEFDTTPLFLLRAQNLAFEGFGFFGIHFADADEAFTLIDGLQLRNLSLTTISSGLTVSSAVAVDGIACEGVVGTGIVPTQLFASASIAGEFRGCRVDSIATGGTIRGGLLSDCDLVADSAPLGTLSVADPTSIERCRFKAPLVVSGSGLSVGYSVFDTGGAAAFSAAAARTIKAAYNRCSNNLLGTNVTNASTSHNTTGEGSGLW